MLRSLPGDEAVSLFAQLLTGGLEPVIGCLASALATLLQPQQKLLDEVAGGAHYCLGAALARLTIAESLEAVARWPGRRRGALDRERADLFGISAFERVLLA